MDKRPEQTLQKEALQIQLQMSNNIWKAIISLIIKNMQIKQCGITIYPQEWLNWKKTINTNGNEAVA